MKTILIADDEESLRTLIVTTLEAPGLRILQAADGNEAVELARQEHPDLVLLDWRMPGKTGIEVSCAAMRPRRTSPFSCLPPWARSRTASEGWPWASGRIW